MGQPVLKSACMSKMRASVRDNLKGYLNVSYLNLTAEGVKFLLFLIIVIFITNCNICYIILKILHIVKHVV